MRLTLSFFVLELSKGVTSISAETHLFGSGDGLHHCGGAFPRSLSESPCVGFRLFYPSAGVTPLPTPDALRPETARKTPGVLSISWTASKSGLPIQQSAMYMFIELLSLIWYPDRLSVTPSWFSASQNLPCSRIAPTSAIPLFGRICLSCIAGQSNRNGTSWFPRNSPVFPTSDISRFLNSVAAEQESITVKNYSWACSQKAWNKDLQKNKWFSFLPWFRFIAGVRGHRARKLFIWACFQSSEFFQRWKSEISNYQTRKRQFNSDFKPIFG